MVRIEHTLRSFYFAERYFKEKKLDFDGINDVLDAIKNHSNRFETDNIITLALIFADKLDIKLDRISNKSKEVIGNRYMFT